MSRHARKRRYRLRRKQRRINSFLEFAAATTRGIFSAKTLDGLQIPSDCVRVDAPIGGPQ